MPQIIVHNHESGSSLGYSLIRLFGQCPSSKGDVGEVLFVSCVSAMTGKRTQYQFPIYETFFKALVLLEEGENNIHLSSQSGKDSDLHFKVNYDPNMINVAGSGSGSKVKGIWFVCKDHDGSFRNMPHEKNDSSEAIKRMQVALLMMQTFCAEKVQDGRRTFPLEVDPHHKNMPLIDVVYSEKYTREEFASLSNDWMNDGGNAAYSHIHNQLVNSSKHTPQTVYYCITSGHYYDPVLNKTKLGAALGGGYLAMWADVNMYSYPNSVDKIQASFMNDTSVDKSHLRDDSAGRGTYYANCATGIGASMHELGHCFGCDHTSTGIMARGFDNFNLFFCVKEPGNSQVFCPSTTEKGAMWHDDSIKIILNHHLYQKECVVNVNGPPQSKPTTQPVAPVDSSNLSILAAAYGPVDVTEDSKDLSGGNNFNIGANNHNFEDSLPGWPKSFSMVLKSESDYYLVTCQEGQHVNVSSKKHLGYVHSPEKIICFTYGTQDLTQRARQLANTGSIHVTNSNFGDTWPNVLKSFMLVYKTEGGDIQTVTGLENETAYF
ncbi:hypothetical protein NAEGRDRAFT_68136 [Naegleria gruberi]|uniref:Zinc metalloproteinase n=1 Tax=Naegleria gruberi TaxID=5762 RepID=D2VH96_NAEGR|nr:uncharacterized protein NAEGRDRAFT_68136 [Naegleria gruberi]EFC43850.1 hypothetical protein NAEGRDRAFT_68136 [Naegleria gruberi]|eukprot:XP_002676594.1 hypothetical protein NAEGRDRAFT_68136 [Naegleria gruberi strain NEG-M]